MEKETIMGSWNDVKLYCIYRHEQPIEMIIQQGPSSLFYACPKYNRENLEDLEPMCNNRLNLVDFTKMLEHLNKVIIDTEMDDGLINLTNYSWKDKKGTEFKVLYHNGSKIDIGVINWRAIRS